MSEKKLPEVTCGMYIQAKFHDPNKAGFEMKIDATYRDLPEIGLTQLEREMAALISRMADFGDAQSKIKVSQVLTDTRQPQR